MRPLVTVAVCTHDHAERLRLTLIALRALRSPPALWELLVVDNASTDETPRLLSSVDWHPPGIAVRVVREPMLGVSNARNRAVTEAAGEYVLFVDDDETPDAAWLSEHVRVMLDFRPDAIGGPIDVVFVDAPRPGWLGDELLGFLGKLDHGPEERWLTSLETKLFTGNLGLRRTMLDTIGAFDPALGRKGRINDGGEDVDLYRRMLAADCRIRWVPAARIVHRIEVGKLRRRYFLELHYRQGRIEGHRKRGNRNRLPPPYLAPQLFRAIKAALGIRLQSGSVSSLRNEMNVAYFLGYIRGWVGD